MGSPWGCGNRGYGLRREELRHYPAKGCSSGPRPALLATAAVHTYGDRRSQGTHPHWHTCRHATAHRPNVPCSLPTWQGHGLSRGIRADAPSSVPGFTLCPILPLSRCQPQAPLARNPPLVPQTRGLRFSALPLTLLCPFSLQTRPCLPGLPTLSCLCGPHLPKISSKAPTTYAVSSAAEGGLSLRMLARSTHETKTSLHWGNCGPGRRRDLPQGPQG